MHGTHIHNRFAKKETRFGRLGITRGQALLFLITFALFFYLLTELVFATAANGASSSPEAALDSEQVDSYSVQEVTVRKGDSLWKLATRYQGEDSMEVNQLIEEIKALNDLDSPIIYPGQTLLIPMS